MLQAQADLESLAANSAPRCWEATTTKAGHLAEQYTAALSQQWASMSQPERASSGIPKQAVELLTWAREMTIMQHAMAAEHLAAIEKANRYLTARANYLRTAAHPAN